VRLERLRAAGLDENAATNLVTYLDEQRQATGVLPDDRTIAVERFRDEIGDWRVCIHSPFGAPVHAPWAQAIEARISERLGLEVQTMYSDDGIVVRLPEADEAPAADSILFGPEEVDDLVLSRVGSSALFAGRFREAAARALLLPRRRPDRRTPLWQQRQRGATLQQVASKYPAFPIVLETYRECLRDVFDLPALIELMASIQRREVRVVEVDTQSASPFASSLLFGYIAAFMYEGDAPMAERRAQALTLDRAVLAELLGREQLRDLIDQAALEQLELELQLLSDDRKIDAPDHLHDALRRLGDLAPAEARARATGEGADRWFEELRSTRRAMAARIAGEERWVAMEDAARFRDALGTALPVGVPAAFLEPVADPVGDLVARFARTHGPFSSDAPARRLGLGVAVVDATLRRLESEGRVIEGEFRPDGSGREWVDAEVLRKLRGRSLAAYRREVEPAPPVALVRFLVAWQGIGPASPRRADPDALYRTIERLQGAPLPASALERLVLAVRLPGYQPAMLDALCASGEVVWAGGGALGSDDGWVTLCTAEAAPFLLPEPLPVDLGPQAQAVRTALAERGALFFRQVADALGPSADDGEAVLALWELVWAGVVTNDTLGALWAFVVGAGRRRSSPATAHRRRGPAFPSRLGPPVAAGRWSLLPPREPDATRRLHAAAEQLLDRHGIVTRGAVVAERVPGGFASTYAVLKAFEESGRCRRGYFVEGLGGAQFAAPGAVDRMRGLVEPPRDRITLVLSAPDPANPYGAALGWPEREAGPAGTVHGHRPGRKAGAVVVLVDGDLALYVERGGRSFLTYSDDLDVLRPAVDALALAVRDGALGKLDVERADGDTVFDSPLATALAESGFRPSTKGLRLRS
jgi:ATP-dependent Lhr-like helicase